MDNSFDLRKFIQLILKQRADPIVDVLDGKSVFNQKLWRFLKSSGVRLVDFTSEADGYRGEYRNKKDEKGLLVLDAIRIADYGTPSMTKQQVVKSDVQSTKTASFVNSTDSIVTQVFRTGFTKLKSKQSSFELGFKQSIEASFEYEGGGATVGAKVTSEFEQRVTDAIGEEDTSTTEVETSFDQPPHSVFLVSSQRTVDTLRQVINAEGEPTFGIKIGKHWDHKWSGSKSWSSWELFLKTLQGQSANNVSLGKYFRDNPISKAQLKMLTKPLNTQFSQELEFEGADGYKTVITDTGTGKTTVKPVDRLF